MKKDKALVLMHKILRIFHVKTTKKMEKLFIQIFKFIIVGGFATIIDFLLIYVFREMFKLPVVISNTMSFTISTIYNYIASIKWVFEVDKSKNKRKTFITFIVFSVIGLLLNDLIIWIIADKFNIYYLIGKIIATAIVMVFNFITRKLFLE